MFKRIFTILALSQVFIWSSVCSQDILTLEQALNLAKENNLDYQQLKRLEEIAIRDVTLGNAGFLPTVSLTGSTTRSITDTKTQLLTSATEKSGTGIISTGYGVTLGASWTVFSGNGRIVAFKLLKDTRAKAIAAAKAQLDLLVSQVSNAYYEMVRQQEILVALQNNMDLYYERLRLSEYRLANGIGAKSDVLLTKVDINTQKSNLIRQKVLFKTAAASLNQLLGRDPALDFNVSLTDLLPKTDTTIEFASQNNSLLVTQKDIDIAEDNLKTTQSGMWPRLGVNANYAYNQSQSQLSTVLFSSQYGPTFGASLSWGLFNGFNVRRTIADNKTQINISRLAHQQNILIQSTQFVTALTRYTNALNIYKLETESYQLAVESTNIAKERFRNGQINLFEFKDTQLVLEDCKVRVANARFEALSSEAELKRLNSDIPTAQ